MNNRKRGEMFSRGYGVPVRADDGRFKKPGQIKSEREQREKIILENPQLSLAEMEEVLRDLKLYSKRSASISIRCAIAKTRERERLIAAGKIKPPKDDSEELAARIREELQKEQIPKFSEKAKIQRRRKACRSITAYLRSQGWSRVGPPKDLELSFWKEPRGGSVHRLDMAFIVAIGREATRSRILAGRL